MTAFFRKWVVRCGYAVAGLIILSGLMVSSARLLTPFLNEHRSDFETWAAQYFNRSVHIGEIDVSWNYFEPELTFRDVTVIDPTTRQAGLSIPLIRINMAIFESLIHRTFILESLKIAGVHLQIHEQKPGEITVQGVNQFVLTDSFTGNSVNPNAALAWIFIQPRLVLQHFEIQYVAHDGTEKDVTLKWLALSNTAHSHRLTGKAILNQDSPTIAAIHFNWEGDITDLPHVSADLSLTLDNIFLAQWFAGQTWHGLHFKKGRGNANIEATWKNGGWQTAQTDAEFYESTLLLDPVFANPLTFDRVTGSLHAEKDKTGAWLLTAKNVQVINEDMNATADLSMTFPEQDSPSINLVGHFTVPHAKNISDYLPLKIYDPELNTWLRGAFKGGQVLAGSAILRGRLSDFPFDNGSGKFEIDGAVKDVALQYAPGWPVMKNIDGNLVFSNRSMTVDIANAMLSDIPLQNIHADIPNLGDNPVLTAKNTVQTDLAKGLKFIQNSPLRQTVGKNLQAVELSGPMQLVLNLSVPLNHPDTVKVTGDTTIANAVLKLPVWQLMMDQLTGTFHFTEDSLTASNMTAQLFKRPVTLNFVTAHPKGKSGFVTANLQGTLSTADLVAWLDVPAEDILQGTTSFQTDLILTPPHDASQPTHVIIHSDLKGVSVNLPGSYGKKSADKANFSVDMSISEKQPLKADIRFNNLRANVSKTQTNFLVGLTSPDMAGQITIPRAGLSKGIEARFQRLNLSSDLIAGRKKPLDPADFPPISFTGDDVRYGDIQLGRVTLNLAPERSGVAIKQLDLASASYVLHATGTWTNARSRLQGTLTSSNVTDTIKSFGFSSSNLIATKADMDFDLNWPGGFFRSSLKEMAGRVSLNMGEGRIINLSEDTNAKMGLGRLLNIFSLQSLQRRLSLNFKDLSGQGYDFDSLKGDFSLSSGSAVTQNTRFSGPIATIDIAGRIGFFAKDLDLKISVTPHVTESLPVVAAIATANPIAGVATWVVDKMVSPAVSHITTYDYSITGSWANPVWQQMNARGSSVNGGASITTGTGR
ncbi:MAG TPA: DUF3971 domain-containing protein [Gammaproteobacteria bacterium]|nr:DUF3971 domain-containing protein [Gammaproteobacteria bacterium]